MPWPLEAIESITVCASRAFGMLGISVALTAIAFARPAADSLRCGDTRQHVSRLVPTAGGVIQFQRLQRK
jgi:hypothetical protein